MLEFFRKLKWMGRRRNREADLREEIQFHLDEEAEEAMSDGLPEHEAKWKARRSLGNVTRIEEQTRTIWGWTIVEQAWQDLCYAARAMRRSPAFFASAAFILALGIGANTAIFTVVREVVLNPLHYPDSDRLVLLWKTMESNAAERTGISPADFLDLQRDFKSCSSIAGFSLTYFDATSWDEGFRIPAARVSANYFETLGVQPSLGRSFAPSDDQASSTKVAILSHNLWDTRFGRRREIVGDTILLNNERYLVVGIMPQSFSAPEVFGPGTGPELWTPFRFSREVTERGSGYVFVVGRLGNNVTLKAAEAEMTAIASRFAASMPFIYKGRKLTFVPLRNEVVGRYGRLLFLLWGAVGCIILIACTNIANMLLTRGNTRKKEMGLRASLGASRGRLVRQLMTEHFTMAITGGTLGVLLAMAIIRMIPAIGLPALPRLDEIAVDGGLFGFAMLLSVVIGLLFGTLPAWQISGTDLHQAVRAGSRTSPAHRSGFLSALFVVMEISLALLLVAGAGLAIRSFWVLQQSDLGFRAEQILALDVSLPSAKYKREEAPAFYQQLLERMKGIPGTEGVGAISYLPLAGDVFGWGFHVQGHPTVGGAPIATAEYRIVSTGFFDAMGVSIAAGRGFDEHDTSGAPGVGVISEQMARLCWPNENAIGKQFRLAGPPSMFPWITVVGVVADVRFGAIDKMPGPAIYRPMTQWPSTAMSLVIRGRGHPVDRIASARDTIRVMDRDAIVLHIREFTQDVSNSFAARRYTTALLSAFAVLALLVASFGIYSVISFSVSQRTGEIGLRIALGAERGQILGMIMGRGMGLAAIGICVGLLGTWAISRSIANLLYGITPADPLTIATVSFILLVVCLAASYLPARRASSLSPITALRHE